MTYGGRLLRKARRRVARALGYSSSRLDTRSPVILLYHRVADLDSDPWGLAVSPANFRQHMRLLGTHGLGISLSELVHELSSGRAPSGKVCVTFDDGYADNLLNAKPILEECGVPATFFLTSGNLQGDRDFWWDALEGPFFRARRLPGDLHLRTESTALTLDLGEDAEYRDAAFANHRRWRAGDPPPSRRHHAYREAWEALYRLSADDRERAVDAIRAWANDVDLSSDSRPLTADQVRQLASGPLVEVGGHSVSHPSLPQLHRREQAREIAENKAQLEALVGRPLRHFAYPHGDYSDDTVALVEAAGYRSACTCDTTAISKTVSAFRLPRICAEDWSGPEFSRRIGRGCPGPGPEP